MSKNVKNRQSRILGILITFMMIGVGLFAGCTSNNTNPSDNTPIFSDNSLAVLDTAYNEYDCTTAKYVSEKRTTAVDKKNKHQIRRSGKRTSRHRQLLNIY